jgi:hypothetical protein
VTTLQVEAVMKSLDVDNDGRVTFTEFSNALELIEYVPHPLHVPPTRASPYSHSPPSRPLPTARLSDRKVHVERELLRISERAHPGLDLKCLATPDRLLFLPRDSRLSSLLD